MLGVARGRSGKITFIPGTGDGRHTIVAALDQDGSPARNLRVASFTAPRSTAPLRTRRVRAKRAHGRIRVTWRRVPGAVRYEVLVKLADGSQAFRVVRGTGITVADPAPGRRGQVLVDGLAVDGARGSARSVKVKPASRRRG